ncbi:arginine--tRNA ligase [Candidatus Nomurabacteria bacterium]|nr:arginine--tRNA ligase [Candidatus Nomurabacteria bacterium]
MIQKKIQTYIADTCRALGIETSVILLEQPSDMSHGDYSTNIAMVHAKIRGVNPKALAEQIVEEMNKNLPAYITQVQVAGPGFTNFTLSSEYFKELIDRIGEEKEMFGKSTIHTGKKILVEHSSPNLFKPFHIGHMMNNAIGESLAQLMRFSGADVETMSFPSDISLGVAKAIFILLEKYPDGNLKNPSIEILGNAYVEGVKRYDEDESIHARVKEIADNLYAGKPSLELEFFTTCKKFNIEYFEYVVARLGSHFDSYIYESEAGVCGKELVTKNTPAIFTESDGAIVYIPEESKKHLNTAVFINSQGNPTYEAKDLGLLDLKFERVSPDLSLFVTDSQQVPHFQIVLDAAEKINQTWVQKSVHVPHGRMTFKGQKMSSRLGGVPLVTDILDTVAEEARARSTHGDVEEILDSVSIGAIKFAILRAKPGQHINFDPETSLSFEGDSGPYLQYTHARIQSIIAKAQLLNIDPVYQFHQTLSDVERTLLHFPEIVERAIAEYAPQHIVTYLLELARTFNAFYAGNQIIDASDIQTSSHRLALAQTTAIVLKNGLTLLGIKAPERM